MLDHSEVIACRVVEAVRGHGERNLTRVCTGVCITRTLAACATRMSTCAEERVSGSTKRKTPRGLGFATLAVCTGLRPIRDSNPCRRRERAVS